MFPRTRGDLDGPPFALPALLDRVSERWWRARPRARVLLSLSAVVLIVVAGIAHAAAAPHGPPAVAWVASHDLVVGHVLEPGDLERTDWPSGLLPDGALREPRGTLAAPLPRGAVATERHLGDAGVAAGLPDGTVAVPVPLEVLPDLPAGARIDLVASDLGGGAHLLTSGAVVLHTDAVAVWLAVEQQTAPQVAGAALHGPIGVIVVPR